MNQTIEEAEHFVFSRERVIREFKEYQLEQLIDHLQAICNEYNVTMEFLYSSTLRDETGEEIEDGIIYDTMWSLVNCYEDNLGGFGTMIIKPRSD